MTLFAKDKPSCSPCESLVEGLDLYVSSCLSFSFPDFVVCYREITGISRMTGKSDMLSHLFDAPWASSHQCFYLANNNSVYGRHVLSLKSSSDTKRPVHNANQESIQLCSNSYPI